MIQHVKNNRDYRVWFQNLVTKNDSVVGWGVGVVLDEQELSHSLKGERKKDVNSLLYYEQDKCITETKPLTPFHILPSDVI